MREDSGLKPSATGAAAASAENVAEGFSPQSPPRRVAWTPADFEEVLGSGSVREADASDAIDGVMPQVVVRPSSVEEVSEVMRLANQLDLAVVVRGSGTKIGWGAPPRRLDVVLETGGLDRPFEHSAGDLVAIAGAGTSVGVFQDAVSARGQMLAVDSPWPQATLGGMVASNFSGPRRHRYGTIRDSLIGITVVLADGTVARAGGKVVKNVAGYDLGKLFIGSFGTLGVIVEVIVRLHALPAERRVVVLDVKSAETVGEGLRAILDSPLVPAAVELKWKEGAGSLAVVFEGFGPAVDDGAERAVGLLESLGAVRILDGDGGLKPSATGDRVPGGLNRPAAVGGPTPGVGPYQDMDGSLPDGKDVGQGFSPESPPCRIPPVMDVPWKAGEVCLKVATVPAALPATLRAIDTLAWARGIETRVTGQAGATVLWVALRNNGDTVAELIEALRSVVARSGGSVVIVAAPDDLKPRLDVWGPTTDAFPLMQRIKEQFDPRGILSPGRFVGGL